MRGLVKVIVVRHMLGQLEKLFDESQRENIFHTSLLMTNYVH